MAQVYFYPSPSLTLSAIGSNGQPIPTTSILIGGSDGTNLRPILVDSAGHLIIDNTTTGGATAANQVLEITQLTGIHSDTTALNGKTVHVDTDNVTVVSSTLPTGAATSANQTSEITQLTAIAGSTSSIDTKTPTVGQKTMANSSPVVIASDQSAVPISAASLPLPTGAATSALQTTGNTSLASIDTKTPALGQALAASSVPVVLTAAQLTTLTPLTSVTVTQATGTNLHTVVDSSALPTGAATSALQTTGNTSLASIDSKLTSPLTVTGPLTDTQLRATPVPVSGTVTANAGTGTFAISAASLPLPTGAATSALQTTGNTSLSSIDGKLGTLGQKAMAGSAPVVLASDQSAIPVNSTPVTPAAKTVTSTALSVGTSAVRLTVSGSAPAATRVLLAATPDTTSTATFYIGPSGVTNSGATRGVQIVGGQPFVANNDAGDYYIVSSTAGQTVFITEQA